MQSRSLTIGAQCPEMQVRRPAASLLMRDGFPGHPLADHRAQSHGFASETALMVFLDGADQDAIVAVALDACIEPQFPSCPPDRIIAHGIRVAIQLLQMLKASLPV